MYAFRNFKPQLKKKKLHLEDPSELEAKMFNENI